LPSNPLYKTYLIMKKDLTEFYRIKARLVTMILFPVILMLLFGYMFPSSGAITHISIGVVLQDQSTTGITVADKFIYTAQSSGLFNVKSYASLSEAENQLTLGNLYGVVIFNQGIGQQLQSTGKATVQVILDQLNPTLDQAVKGEITEVFGMVSAQLTPTFTEGVPNASSSPLIIQFKGLIPGNVGSFEFLAPGLIAMNMIIGGLSGLAMTFSREKELGTLDGFLMSPVSRLSIIFGKSLAQVVRGVISGIIVFVMCIVLFGVKVYGNILLMALVLLLGILAFTGLGILATSLVSDQESAQLIILMIQFPMIFLSGVLYPIIQLPEWLRIIAYFLPLTYVVSAFRSEMILNVPFSAIFEQVVILSIFTLVVFIIAVPLFRRSVTK
jgi:ABC-2 type transport system permease protein